MQRGVLWWHDCDFGPAESVMCGAGVCEPLAIARCCLSLICPISMATGRDLVLKDYKGNFDFRNTWKQTWVDQYCGNAMAAPTIAPIKVEGVYSDYLFQPWFCASMGTYNSIRYTECPECTRFSDPLYRTILYSLQYNLYWLMINARAAHVLRKSMYSFCCQIFHGCLNS